MKRIIVSISILFIILIGCTSEKNMFIGEWTGTNVIGEKMTMIFDADGYVTLIDSDNTITGGKDKELSIKYTFDMTKEPAWLDLITFNEGKETMRNKAIIKFIGKNKMQFKILRNSPERPTDFKGSDTVLLTKVN